MKFIRPTKRTILISVASLVILTGAGAYTWQSLAAWKSYESRLQTEQVKYEQLKEAALNADTPERRLAAIQELDDKLEKRAELCKMNGLYAWQSAIIPVLGAGVKECETKVKRLGLVAAPLSALRDYLEASAKVQDIVAGLAPGEALKDSNWIEKGLERAKSAKNELKELPVSGDAATLKTQASKLSDSLEQAWNALIKANEAKDKAAFLAASAAVTKAYADFAGLADSADAQIQTKVDAVIKAVNEQ